MTMTAADADLSEGLAMVAAGLDQVLAAGIDPEDSPEAIALIEQVETVGRRLDAARVALVEAIDRTGLYRTDGHHSAKIMVRHVAKLSGSEAAARARTARALRDLPETRAVFEAGRVGTCQVRRLARIHANPRVRDRLAGSEGRLLGYATGHDYRFFDEVATNWVRLADEDGTCEVNQANHERRNAHLWQGFDLGWHLDAACGSLSGAEMKTIFDHFVDAEFRADWDKAKIDHGDATTKADLERTDGQRRFDALYAIFQRAAAAEPGGKAPEVVTNLVIDDATYERTLIALTTGTRPDADPDDESYRCSTLDGHPIEATEAVAASLLGKLRRVVVGTGGGTTNPHNAGPACGKHNRHTQAGYTVWRDPTGRWHTHRPDGTEIEEFEAPSARSPPRRPRARTAPGRRG